MGVFHVFKIVQMVPIRAKYHISECVVVLQEGRGGFKHLKKKPRHQLDTRKCKFEVSFYELNSFLFPKKLQPTLYLFSSSNILYCHQSVQVLVVIDCPNQFLSAISFRNDVLTKYLPSFHGTFQDVDEYLNDLLS